MTVSETVLVSPNSVAACACVFLCHGVLLALALALADAATARDPPILQAGQLLHEQTIADLLADLEETKSAYRTKRDAARAAEGAARKAKRELSASRAVRCAAWPNHAPCVLLGSVIMPSVLF